MLAIRCLVRTFPRNVQRVPIGRAIPTVFTARTCAALPKPSAFAFSTSTFRREPAGPSDTSLAAKLGSEKGLEIEEIDPAAVPERIQSFFDNSSYEVEDNPGTHTVTLSRKHGNETIKIEFSISDMNQIDEDFDMDEDNALEDEDFTTQGKRTINQSGTKGGKIDIAPEDRVAPSDEGAFDEDSMSGSYPLGLNITITKPVSGATYIRAHAEDGNIEIDSINYFANADLIEPKTPEEVKLAQSQYEGPPFMNLDQELQTMLYQYLEERDINAELATILPEYVDFKEQREYVQWLDNMKKFIDA